MTISLAVVAKISTVEAWGF